MADFEEKPGDLDAILRQIIDFLVRIGFIVTRRDLPDDTFLPGIAAEGPALLIDPSKLKYPSDLLHEAGHLAVLSPAQRLDNDGDFSADGGNEMAAIAWSYAACVHLELPLDVLFHEDGYKGDAAWLRETFSAGNYIGLPILMWKEMTCLDGDEAYPKMKHWLCVQDPTD